jgi:hypothetical protein
VTLFTIKPPLHALFYGMAVRTRQIELLAHAGSAERHVRLMQCGLEDAAVSDQAYFVFLSDRINRLDSLAVALSKELQARGLTNTGREQIDKITAQISDLSSIRMTGSVRHPFYEVTDCVTKLKQALGIAARYFSREQDNDDLHRWCELGIAVMNVFIPETDESQLAPWEGVFDWSEHFDLDYAEWSDIESADFKWREPTRVREILGLMKAELEAILPLPRENDTEQVYFQKLTPRGYPEWYRVELGFDRLIYGAPSRRPRDVRDDLFLKWEQEMVGDNEQINKAIAQRWNALKLDERERIASECDPEVSTQTVKKSRQYAKERQLLEIAMRNEKSF